MNKKGSPEILAFVLLAIVLLGAAGYAVYTYGPTLLTFLLNPSEMMMIIYVGVILGCTAIIAIYFKDKANNSK